MEYDQDKVDEMTLALLFLVTTKGAEGEFGARAGRSFDMETMRRLYEKGWINDPKTKSLSIEVTVEGFERSRALFLECFGEEE